MASSSNQEETAKKKLAFLLNPLFVYCFQEIPKKKEEQIKQLLEDHPTIRGSFKSFLKNQKQTEVPNTHNSVLISQLQGILSTHKMSSSSSSSSSSSQGKKTSTGGSSISQAKKTNTGGNKPKTKDQIQKETATERETEKKRRELERKKRENADREYAKLLQDIEKSKSSSYGYGAKPSTSGSPSYDEGSSSSSGYSYGEEHKHDKAHWYGKSASHELGEYDSFYKKSHVHEVVPKDVLLYEEGWLSSVLELAIKFPVFIRKTKAIKDDSLVLVLFFKGIRTAFHKASLGKDVESFPFDDVLYLFMFFKKEILSDKPKVQTAAIKLYKKMRGIDPETEFFLSTETLEETKDMIQKELDACISKVAIVKMLSNLKESKYLSDAFNTVLVKDFGKPELHDPKGEGPLLKKDELPKETVASRLKRSATQRKPDTEPSEEGSVRSRIVKKKAFNESSDAAHATTMNGKKNEQSASKPTRASSNVWKKPVIESPLLKSHA